MEDEEFRKIIAAYDQATQGLQKTHESLRAQVAHLSGELSEKNRELTCSLEEVSALKNYLANILESITDGVIAIDLGSHQSWNAPVEDIAANRAVFGCGVKTMLGDRWQIDARYDQKIWDGGYNTNFSLGASLKF